MKEKEPSGINSYTVLFYEKSGINAPKTLKNAKTERKFH